MSLARAGQNEHAARALGGLVREASDSAETTRRASMSARRRDLAARERLSVAIQSRGAPRDLAQRVAAWLRQVWWSPAGRRGWAGLGLVAVACATWLVLREGKLDYVVDGAGEDGGGYVRAADHSVAVRFEEGSTFSFAKGSSGRIGEVRAKGAAIALEDGTVEAFVAHRSGARWSALAGPWEVLVTGTRFDVAWDPRAHSLRVDLLDGKVTVRGPGAGEGIVMHAGQSLRAEGDEIRVTSLQPLALQPGTADAESSARSNAPSTSPDATPPPGSTALAVPQPSSVPSAPEASTAPPASSAGVSSERRLPWGELVAKGRHDVVLAEARERGVPLVLTSASASDLLALADASRYGGDAGLASRALQALRDRFAGTKAASDAAFLLGRMADDGGATAAAIRWYDTHMAEGGSFSAEALGRKMIAVRKSGSEAAARPVAREYLQRYPHGPHAAVARALLEGDVGFGKPATSR